MITEIEKISEQNFEKVIERAAHILRNGGLVAFPTETVYGLGANAYDAEAAKKIYEAKGRPSDNPLIVHISNMDMLYGVCGDVPPLALTLAERFWPGPLTLVTSKGASIPYETTGGLETVAVRLPDNKIAAALIESCGFAIAAPSANASGKPSPTRASHVEYDLMGKIDMIIDGGACTIGLESTIADVTGETPVILRPGNISEHDILKCADTVLFADGTAHGPPKAPGTKYRHYSPKARITIVEGEQEAVARKIGAMIGEAGRHGEKAGALVTDETRHLYNEGHIISLGSSRNLEEVAANLFKALRKLDFYELDSVFSVGFEEDGLGVAIMNRLKKAAEGRIIDA